MKLFAITRVKNELDIIEPFVRHHAALCDQIIVLDDGSVDGTYELLQEMRREGLPLVLLREPSVGYSQAFFMTRLMRLAVEQHDADWVLPLDADEFLETQDETPLRALLEARPPELLRILWNNFAWRLEDDASAELNPVLRLTMRMPPRSDLAKVIVPARMVREGFELRQGSHTMRRGDEVQEGTSWDAARLCHFPMRSVAQYAGKVAIGYLQYSSMPGWTRTEGIQYLEPFRILSEGAEQLAPSMAAQSRRYSVLDGVAVDDAPVHAPLRYLGGPLTLTVRRDTLVANLLHCAEALAKALAEARRQEDALAQALKLVTPEQPELEPLARVHALRAARDEALRARENAIAEHAQARSALDAELDQARQQRELLAQELLREREALAAEKLAAQALEAEKQREAVLGAELRVQLGRAEEEKAQLGTKLAAAGRDLVLARETVAQQADQLSSRAVQLVQRLHRYAARRGLDPAALADRIYRLFGM